MNKYAVHIQTETHGIKIVKLSAEDSFEACEVARERVRKKHAVHDVSDGNFTVTRDEEGRLHIKFRPITPLPL